MRLAHKLINENSKIINGEISSISKFPFMISLGYLTQTSYFHICGGSIINTNQILSAKHCVSDLGLNYNPDKFYKENGFLLVVVSGTSQIQSSIILNKLKQKEVYKVKKLEYKEKDDISILTLDNYLNFTKSIEKVQIPLSNDSAVLNGKEVIAVGWGVNEKGELSTVLNQANLTVLNGMKLESECEGLHENNYCLKDLSSKKANVCYGDSGGPLLFMENKKWTVYGTASFVFTDQTGNCLNQLPSFYAKLPTSWAWIKISNKFL
ncbi:unnamed protein product [Brachionus calyciflorus]|uniref:Peptidase S1 domain-containing protein n=1 Tax=Brachionus calyciflorus TaxID=104777 RepID=A0A814SJT4_9BILA|nr:unnamed protein product [Brachionus calyciflorus]